MTSSLFASTHVLYSGVNTHEQKWVPRGLFQHEHMLTCASVKLCQSGTIQDILILNQSLQKVIKLQHHNILCSEISFCLTSSNVAY